MQVLFIPKIKDCLYIHVRYLLITIGLYLKQIEFCREPFSL